MTLPERLTSKTTSSFRMEVKSSEDADTNVSEPATTSATEFAERQGTEKRASDEITTQAPPNDEPDIEGRRPRVPSARTLPVSSLVPLGYRTNRR